MKILLIYGEIDCALSVLLRQLIIHNTLQTPQTKATGMRYLEIDRAAFPELVFLQALSSDFLELYTCESLSHLYNE